MEPRDPIPTFLVLQEQLPEARNRRQREFLLRILMGIAGGLGVLLAIFGILLLRFDPNAHRGQIEAAVKAATGRDFHVGGRMAITSYRHLRIAASDVVLGNASWGTKPEMMHMNRVEVDLDMVALLSGRLEIPRLVVEEAEILLEVGKAGDGNWQFNAGVPAPAASVPAPRGAPPRAGGVVIHALHLRDAHIVWHDSRSGKSQELTLRRFTTSENPRDMSVLFGAEVVIGAQPIVINGQSSSLTRLLEPNAKGAPWGVTLTAEIPGMRASIAGSIERPLEMRGYKLRLDGVASDPAAFANLIGTKLPPLRNTTFSTELADDGSGVPQLSNLMVQIGTTDMDSLARGLQIEQAVVTAKSGADPITLEAKGTLTATDLRARMRLGTLRDALRGDRPMPLALLVTLGESTFSANGTVPPLGAREGLDLEVRARLRDLAEFSAFLGQRLPPMRPVTFAGRVATTGSRAIALRDATLATPQAQIGLDADLDWEGHPSLKAYLRGERLDVDALLKAFSGITFGPPSNEIPLGALPIPRSIRPVISDRNLDFGWLGAMNLDLQVTLDNLTLGGVQAKAVSGQVNLIDRHLVVRPMTATLAGGAFSLVLDLDAGDPKQPVAMVLRAPAIDLRAMLQSFGRGEDISGLMEVNADLHGAGPSLHAIAGSMTGAFGLSLVDGQIDNSLLGDMLGGLGRAAGVVREDLFPPGRSRIRCLALRLDSQDGHGTVPSFVLDAGRALIQANGSVELGAETYNMKLLPTLRIAPREFTLPLKLGGRFRAPELAVDKGDVTEGAAARPSAPARAPDACPAGLAAARGGAGGLMPTQAPAAPLVPTRLLHLPAR